MFEIYAYGNVDTLTGVFNAIAAIMGGADYFGLIKTVAITGMLVAAFAGLFTPGRFAGWGWFIGFMMVYNVMFLPKVDVVVIDKLGSQTPVAVGNAPIGVAFFGHYTSRVGDVMTRFFETAFQAIPDTNAQSQHAAGPGPGAARHPRGPWPNRAGGERERGTLACHTAQGPPGRHTPTHGWQRAN